MSELIVHADTARLVAAFTAQPSHALLLAGRPGMGKASLAKSVAEQVLHLAPGGLPAYPYVRYITPDDGKAIGIEMVRELEHFLSLRVPSPQAINRLVIIEDSHLLSIEAQNALLKTLEEPPLASVLIFTAQNEAALLPTIRSRMQTINVKRPALTELTEYFTAAGHSSPRIAQVQAISGGLPGLMSALLEQTDHPLLPATQRARQLLQQSTFERLASVDELAKQKTLCRDVLFILGQMSELQLKRTSGRDFAHWAAILRASYACDEALERNAQPKLALTHLMLQLG
ncbi:MAG: AAA family ATPase [Candidatus Saccharibacteria bacterium]